MLVIYGYLEYEHVPEVHFFEYFCLKFDMFDHHTALCCALRPVLA